MNKSKYIFQNIVFILTVFLSSTFFSLLAIIVSIFSKKSSLIKKIEYIWARSVVWASGCNIVADIENLDKNKFYVFISNHFSHLDTPILITILKDFSPRFVAKDSLFKIPIFGWAMKKAGHISINRKNKRQALKDLNRAVNTIKQGKSILLFPEGTRNPKEDELLEFQIGAFILAIKLGLEMVPVIICGTNKCLPRGARKIRPCNVYVKVCKPLDWPKKFSLKQREELKNKTKSFMQNKYLELINGKR